MELGERGQPGDGGGSTGGKRGDESAAKRIEKDNRRTGLATGTTKCKLREGRGGDCGWWVVRSAAAKVASKEVALARH